MIVTIESITPPERWDDDAPWTLMRLEESATKDGTFVAIETFALDPLDTNPRDPLERNLTSSNATLENGFYRVVFIDGAAGESLPTEPIQNVSSVYSEVRPHVRRLAAMLPTRTVDKNGVRQDTFTENTRPTEEQAEAVIDEAVNLVLSEVGENIPARLYARTRTTILLVAAALVELQHYPEQVAQGNSAYDQMWAMYAGAAGVPGARAALINALRSDEASSPYSFINNLSIRGINGQPSDELDEDLLWTEIAGPSDMWWR